MSDEEEDIEDEQNQDEDEEPEEDEDEDVEDQDEDEDGDQDEDEDQDGDQDQDQNEDQQGDEDQQKSEQQKPVPSFKPVSQQFAFKNLLAQIASIGNSVDHFISSLPSRGGSGYRSYQPRIELDTKPRTFEPVIQDKKYTIMKDEDVQVSMQPQIVIQQTLAPRQQPKKEPYRISNQSTKFLAQLYEQNKKLKRWQNNQSASQTSAWYKSKDKFERPEHERGLINLEDRNKEIDQAIEMLRREQNN